MRVAAGEILVFGRFCPVWAIWGEARDGGYIMLAIFSSSQVETSLIEDWVSVCPI